jgi:hypothetical protein
MEFHRAKIINCKPFENYELWIKFEDGLEGKVNLSHLVGKGVFSAWNSVDFFKSVEIDKQTDTVAWGEEIDLDPYVLYENIKKQQPN